MFIWSGRVSSASWLRVYSLITASSAKKHSCRQDRLDKDGLAQSFVAHFAPNGFASRGQLHKAEASRSRSRCDSVDSIIRKARTCRISLRSK